MNFHKNFFQKLLFIFLYQGIFLCCTNAFGTDSTQVVPTTVPPQVLRCYGTVSFTGEEKITNGYPCTGIGFSGRSVCPIDYAAVGITIDKDGPWACHVICRQMELVREKCRWESSKP